MATSSGQFAFLLGFFVLLNGASSLVISSTNLQTKDGENYVLHGGKAILTCFYHLSPGEEVVKVQWLRDDEEVYVWTSNLPPVAKGPFEGRVDLANRAANSVNITYAHLSMHGLITCRVSTGGLSSKVTEDNLKLIVIVDACGEDSFSHHFDSIECTETIRMRCTGIFPRPSPMCGVFDTKKMTFVQSSPFDSVSPLKNDTYEISFSRKYEIADFFNMTDIVFSCSITIQDTNWKVKVVLNMFGDSGCARNPPEIENGYYNLTSGRSCRGYPGDGEEAVYTCDASLGIDKTEKLICRNGSWVSEKIEGNAVIVKENYWPHCGARGSPLSLSFVASLLIAISISLLQFH